MADDSAILDTDAPAEDKSRSWRERLAAAARLAAKVFPWVAICLPPLLLALLIREHAVNIPFLDDWMFTEFLHKAQEGTLQLRDFFSAQMEHRIAFVRAVILARHWLSPQDIRPEMWLSWLMLCGTSINIFLLMRRTFGDFKLWWAPMALISMILFTPLLYQIVLWAMMFQVVCPFFFLTTAMVVVLSDRLGMWVRFGICVACALCATLSFASGMEIWVLLVPLVLWVAPFADTRQRSFFLYAWLGVFALTAALYFHNLKNEVDPAFAYGAGKEETLGGHVGGFLSDPERGIRFVLGFLGCHLGRGTSAPIMDLAVFFGAISLLLIAGFSVCWLLRFRDVSLRIRWLPWLLLGGYSVAAAILTAMGRAWATRDADGSIAARYIVHAIPLTVALIALGLLAGEAWRQYRMQCDFRVKTGNHIAATVLFLLFLNGWIHGAQIMAVWESARLRGATNTLFFNVMEVEGNVAPNRPLAATLNAMGLLKPPMIEKIRLTGPLEDNYVPLDHFNVSGQKPGRSTARLDSVLVINNKISAAGIAALHARRRAADGVFLTYRDDKDKWIIYHVTQVRQMPVYLDEALDRDLRFTPVPDASKRLGEALTAFTGTCNFSRIPAGRREIRAWIFDYKKQTVYPIDGRFMVDSTSREVKKLE